MMRLKPVLFGCLAVLWATVAQARDLTIWGLQAFNPQADAMIAKMAKTFGEQRGIKVQYVVVPANVLNERLAAAFEGKTAPDVFMHLSQQAQYYATLGLTQPMDEIVKEMRAQPGGIYESLASAMLYKGAVHAIPLEVDVIPMFVRTDLLKKAGLPIPKTWDELRTASIAINKANPQIATLGMSVSNANDAESDIRMIVWSYGGAMFSQDGKTVTWNTPETLAAYEYIADMFAKGLIPRSCLTWDDSSNNTAYQSGRAAFIINPPSVYSWLQANDPELLANTELTNIPSGNGPKARSGTMISAFSWLLSKSSDQTENAKAWLSYFFKPENYQPLIEVTGGRWVPIYPQMTKTMKLFTQTPAFANFDALARDGIVDGFAGPPTALSAQVYAAKIVTKSVQRMLVDGKSARDATAWAQAEIEALADK